MIGVATVDLLRHSGLFTNEEAQEYIEIGALNGMFVLGRTIGFIGHYLDQKRLKQGECFVNSIELILNRG